MRHWPGALAAMLAAEQDNLFLWWVVLFGAGIAIYFALPAEPGAWLLGLAAAAAWAVALTWRQGLAGLIVGSALAALASGLAAGKIASDLHAAPVIVREMASARVTGWVELSEVRADRSERITVRVAAIEGLSAEQRPYRIRVRIPGGTAPLEPGAPVSLRASLLPPSGPALPGAYDFARVAWFMRLGAVGFARARPEPAVIELPVPWTLAAWGPVERLRQAIGARITGALAGETGEIANALITGARGGISEATNGAYRDSGIIHILSISGLHMTIFAGALYVFVRLLLSLVPALALAHEIKKWAAVAGIAGTLGYLLISGGSPPAVRSALMLLVMFAAVLLDRPALALRNVALAALIILIIVPSSLIDVGFQMSFAAVVALISGIEAWKAWRRRRQAGREEALRAGLLAGASLFLATIAVTTLIATASVAPLAAYYFHKSTQYGVLANLIAVPICNLLVMPAALATLIAMPAGLERWPLWAMGIGIDAMTWVAYRVASLPGAVTLVPAISTAALLWMVAGGLWLTLWSGRWRLAGLAPIALGIAIAPWREAPDVLVNAEATLVAVRGADGRLAAYDAGRSTFDLGRWLEHDGDARPPATVGPDRVLRCDALGCMARVRGEIVAIARHAAALRDDCRVARLIVWPAAGPVRCPPGSRATALDGGALAGGGAHAVRLRGGRVVIETVAHWRGERPWSAQQRRSPRPSAEAP